MTRKRFSEEDILNILRQVEMDLAGTKPLQSSFKCHSPMHLTGTSFLLEFDI